MPLTRRPQIGDIVDGATAGSILFAGASGALAQDNANIFYDDANDRLGIGTASPGVKLHVNQTSADLTVRFQAATNGFASNFALIGNNDTGAAFNNIRSTTSGGTEHWYLGGGGVANTLIMRTGGTERLSIASGGRINASSAIHRTQSTTQDTTSGTTAYIESGTYEPTQTLITNLTSITFSSPGVLWIRVGRVVHVSGAFLVDAVATGGCVFDMTLPILSTAFPDNYHVAGAVGGGSLGYGSVIRSSASTTQARAVFNTSSSAVGDLWTFTFSYLIS